MMIVDVEPNPETARRVETEVLPGRFRTAPDAIDRAVALARRGDIGAEIEGAGLKGGESTGEEILRDVGQHLSEMPPKRGE